MYCDHEPLVKAFYSSNQRDNARECRHLSEIASHCTNLRFIKGCDNVVADALSRNEINSIFQHAAKIDWHAFAKAQRNDYELKRYLDETNSANVIEHEWNGATLLCGISRDGPPRPLVPFGFRRIVFDNCHNLTHCGIRATIISLQHSLSPCDHFPCHLIDSLVRQRDKHSFFLGWSQSQRTHFSGFPQLVDGS